ncbi:class I SAM-dependent methyltransferase [Candidatus Gottesmanbacteria bacterium]|nr:class I SAM-dependent methyltransferase [Candidatus Gottesmanbacteria bacterium]
MIKQLWRWHPKVALRYLPIVNRIRNLHLEDKPILEIGSGSLGITPYLAKRVTGLDIDFSGPSSDLLTYVYGSVLKIPFNNNAFDTVLMVDVLEHIPPKNRKKAIQEAVRVAKKFLVIAVPEGRLSESEDKELSEYYKSVFLKEFPFYKEHLEFGLPKKEEIVNMVNLACKSYSKRATIRVEGNVNMKLHNFLMKGWMTNNIFIDLIFRKLMLLFIPIFTRLNQEPVYRKIFYITFR